MADLHALALAASNVLTPSELHGAVCGLALPDPSEPPACDVSALVALVGADAVTDEASVLAFATPALAELAAADLSFAPLGVDENEALTVRLSALAEWCESFLAGLGAALAGAGDAHGDVLQGDAGEIVADLVAISGVDTEVAEDEDAEEQYMQLAEFVKVSVLLLRGLLLDPGNDDEEADSE